MTRVVIDLGGPREFEVVPSTDHVVVRIKTQAATPLPAAAPENASAKKGAEMPEAKVRVSEVPEPQKEVQKVVEKDVQRDVRKSAHVAAAVIRPVSAKGATPALLPASASAVQAGIPPVNEAAQPAAISVAAHPDPARPGGQGGAACGGPGLAEGLDLPASCVSLRDGGEAKVPGEPISVNLKDVDRRTSSA